MGYLALSLIFLCAVGVAGQIGPEVCLPDCLNGGFCHENTCICQGGYRGEYCQIPPVSVTDAVTDMVTVTMEMSTEEPPSKPTMVPTPPPPSPPAPSIFPSSTPNVTTTAPPTPTRLPTPFTTTRMPATTTPPPEPEPTMIPTPPPPPPPSPSLFITPPVSSTPKPSMEPTMTTRRTTMRMTTSKLTTRKEVDPILIETGGVTVTLELPPEEFDSEEQMKFKSTIADNVNEFCSSSEGNCEVPGITVGPNDVVLYEIRGITMPETAAILNLEGTDTVVSFYVTYGDGSSVVLNTEQLDTLLEENADKISDELGYGFQRGAPTPADTLALEWWAILLICVAGAILLIIMGYGLYRNTAIDEKGEKSIDSDSEDVEMQDASKLNGNAVKVRTDMSVQASQSDIIKETKHVFVNHYSADPTAETHTSTQVSDKDILKETEFDKEESSDKKKTDADNNNTAPNVTVATLEDNGNAVTVVAEVESPETNHIPPSYDDATAQPAPSLGEELPPPPPELLRMSSDEANAVGELDNLVKEHKDNSENTFENPAFTADTEIDNDGKPRTEL